jgi:hypothetical protein
MFFAVLSDDLRRSCQSGPNSEIVEMRYLTLFNEYLSGFLGNRLAGISTFPKGG